MMNKTTKRSAGKTPSLKKKVKKEGEKKEEITLRLTKLKLKSATPLKTGLKENEVAARVEQGKTNKTVNKTSKTTRDILLSNLLTVFNFLTFGIAIWLMTIRSFRNTIFIAAVIANIVIGIAQEIKAKNIIEKLSLTGSPTIVVFRDGKYVEIPAEEVVQDDVIKLKTGDQICADCVVVQDKMEVNESLLTGEADPIEKKEGDTIYSGSYVVSGGCLAQAALVGEESYLQKLAAQAKKYKKPNSEIMNSLNILIRVITVLVIIIGVALFIQQNRISSYENAVVATAGGVIGMIPSGLFLITSISLSLGVIKLSRRKTLVNDLYCIEMLARVNTLCLDKTGTITDGTMKVTDVVKFNDDQKSVEELIALLEGTFKDKNPTSRALKKKYGKRTDYAADAIIPFSSVRKYSAAHFAELQATYLLGAPEFIMPKRYEKELQAATEEQAGKGRRVILLASTPETIKDGKNAFNESEITPLALICLEDTIRKSAAETIGYFKKSGVAVKVISGDNPLTVSMIAKRAGVDNADKYISLEGKTDSQLKRLAMKYNVFGRVTPPQKKKLVQIFKEKRGAVAMTGDGVNDILAMKEADCAIAMANGSAATRNIAHLVLLDSNFDSLPAAVAEGRRVINNIQRVATLFLTKTIFSFLLAIIVLATKNAYPLQTIQLIFFDFLVISLPSMYLAFEANNSKIRGKFLANVLVRAIPGALLVGLSYLVLWLSSHCIVAATPEAISTSTVLIATCLGLFVLFKVCKPFNIGRTIMYALMWIIFIAGLTIRPDFFALTKLNYRDFLLAAALILASLSAYPWINRTGIAVKNKILESYAKMKKR